MLLLDEGGLGSRVVAQQVRLKHIEALWVLLQGMTDATDAFAHVHPKYCDPLTDENSEELTKATSRLDGEVLLPLFKSFIMQQLVEDDTRRATITSESTLKENIAWLEAGDTWLGELSWFQDDFPDTVTMAQSLQAFKLLERLQTS